MTYYILQDGTTEKKAAGCLQDLVIFTILIAVTVIAIRRRNKSSKQ